MRRLPVLASGKKHLCSQFLWMMQDVREEKFFPQIVLEDRHPLEFSSIQLTQYRHLECEASPSVSEVLEHFYAARDTYTRIRQKSVDLRKIVSTALERNHKNTSSS